MSPMGAITILALQSAFCSAVLSPMSMKASTFYQSDAPDLRGSQSASLGLRMHQPSGDLLAVLESPPWSHGIAGAGMRLSVSQTPWASDASMGLKLRTR